MWKAKGRLIYSAEYDKERGTVKTRDWREDKYDKKRISGNRGRYSVLPRMEIFLDFWDMEKILLYPRQRVRRFYSYSGVQNRG